MVIVLAGLLPGEHWLVFAVTLRKPLVNEGDTLSRIVALPWPLVMVVPAGLVHTYGLGPLAFVTGAMEYCAVELQMFVVGPLIAPGCKGTLDPTVLHLATLDAQGLVADTQTGGAPV